MATRSFEAKATIQAQPEAVWRIVTDAAGYSEWDSGVVRVEGRIAPGETIKVISKANPGRTFPVKVTQFDPPRRMTWTGGMPLVSSAGSAPSLWHRTETAPPPSPCARNTPARSPP